MTSQRVRDGFEFACDVCGQVWTPPALGRGSEARDFQESWQEAKREGWRAVKSGGGEWEHRCPECWR
jgi:hypothetical protein